MKRHGSRNPSPAHGDEGGDTGRVSIEFTDAALRQDPYPIYARLRSEDPIHYRAQHRDWVLTRYADVAAVLRDPRFGRAFLDSAVLRWQDVARLRGRPKVLAMLQGSRRLIDLWMVNRGTADHARLRAVVSPAFTAERMAKLRPRIEAIVEQRLDEACSAGEIELIGGLAFPLPIDVITDILGMPSSADLERWTADIAECLDLGVATPIYLRGLFAMTAFAEHVRRVVATPRQGTAGLLDVLIAARDRGTLSDDELLANCIMLLFAGHQTTRHLIGNGMLALLRNPDQLEKLRAQPRLISLAIEELLRFDTPGQLIWREVLADAEIGGAQMRVGELAHLLIGAANRDPARFPDPDRLDIERRPNPHLAFAPGAHHCLGAGLARLEAEVAILALLRRAPRLALAAEPEWETTFRDRGVRSLRLAL